MQGDIVSPIFFVVALQLLFNQHDMGGGFTLEGGFTLSGAEACDKFATAVIEVLAYADDSAIICQSIAEASARVTAVCKGSLEDADMTVHCGKTKTQQFRTQPDTPTLDAKDLEAKILEVNGEGSRCEFCLEVHADEESLRAHQRQCGQARILMYDSEFEAEKILSVAGGGRDVDGRPLQRWYQVEWKGSRPAADSLPLNIACGTRRGERWRPTWEKESSLTKCGNALSDFWSSNPDLNPADQIEGQPFASFRQGSQMVGYFVVSSLQYHRCRYCNRFCKFADVGPWSLAAHLSNPRNSKMGCDSRPAEGRRNTKAAKKVYREQKIEAQAELEVVRMGDKELENVFDFPYLGRQFTADGTSTQDLHVRLGRARGVIKRLMHIWKSSQLSESIKRRIYESSVIAVLAYGCESWNLDEKSKKKINHFNNRSCHLIFGTEWGEPAPVKLVALLRARRHNFLGRVLRMEDDRLPKISFTRFTKPYPKGSIFEDVLEHTSMTELVEAAQDKQAWTARTNKVILEKISNTEGPTKANTAAETAKLLAELPIGAVLLYTDGGCDGNGAKGVWGAAGWGCSIRQKVATNRYKTLAELWGPVVTDSSSPYCEGATKGTNNTGELIAIMQGMMWLEQHGKQYANAAVCYDSFYAANILQGIWKAKGNLELVGVGRDLVAAQIERCTFIHVKGHSDDGGNDRADELVQWGKEPGPYCRMQLNGEGEEGDSLHGAAKRMSKAPSAPVAIFSKDYFTEVEAWLNAKAKALEDYEKYSKGEFEITCSTAAADTLHTVLTGTQQTARPAGTLVHLMEHAHPHGGNVADTISNDNHHTTPPPSGEGLPTPPSTEMVASVRRTRSGRVYNREAMDAIDRNSQNVYTRVLSNQ